MGGTKKKVGKSRRDKAYWSAKEIGYRSRASFKLVQLNRKFEFLQKSRVCIDLCAAPGSWMQVAKQHMPLSSLILGVDISPIRHIQGCITLQEDITTDRCRFNIRKELQNWKADLILHDGAPNVGKSWIHDSYQQNLLVLHSFKLASDFLAKDGTFVTKVFRSKDYLKLLWIFKQFFHKVDATKPQASRSESAEIFIVCQFYKFPNKIDPNFFDPKFVFADVVSKDFVEEELDSELLSLDKKLPAEGYDSNSILLFKKISALDFIMGEKPVHVLNNFHEISMDNDFINNHSKTTSEIVEYCKDIRVIGIKELKLLKKWREALRFDLIESNKKKTLEQAKYSSKLHDKTEYSFQEKELDQLDMQIKNLTDQEKIKMRRLKKKSLKEKKKIADKIDLKMIIPGDMGPIKEEDGLFQMQMLKKNFQKTSFLTKNINDIPLDSINYKDMSFLGTRDIENRDLKKNNSYKANLWFDQDIFKECTSNEIIKFDIKNYCNKLEIKSKRFDEEISLHKSDALNNLCQDNLQKSLTHFDINPKKLLKPKLVKKELTPEELNFAEKVFKNMKSKKNSIDDGFNRYMFDDVEWLINEESFNMRSNYRSINDDSTMNKEINIRTIKKVLEAKTRKKKRMYKKLVKARKKASCLLENPDMGNREKAGEVNKLYKKALSFQKKNVTYVVAKKSNASKRLRRPKGVKGFYKQVDPRMKKDKQNRKHVTI